MHKKREEISRHINANEVIIGEDVIFEDNVIISGIDGPAKKVFIGDSVFIGHNTKILVPEITILDYTKLHNHSFIHGYNPCHIGYNCWIGQNTILDSIGNLKIGNNVGIGAYSQLWTHIQFGDTLEGCRFLTSKEINIGDDVWFVGHCIVSPITAEDKSMALVGSVVVKDMKYNHIYGGCPAEDLTEKMGTQFQSVPIEKKLEAMKEKLREFYHRNPGYPQNTVEIVTEYNDLKEGITMFNVANRTYTKRRVPAEIAFMKFLLPEAKFIPYESNSK